LEFEYVGRIPFFFYKIQLVILDNGYESTLDICIAVLLALSKKSCFEQARSIIDFEGFCFEGFRYTIFPLKAVNVNLL